jgi:hypothetical protein
MVARVADWRAKNPDKHAAHDAAYRTRHRERIAAQNADWAAQNPEKRAASQARRRARKARATVEHFTDADLRNYWAANGLAEDRCFYTGEPLDAWPPYRPHDAACPWRRAQPRKPCAS